MTEETDGQAPPPDNDGWRAFADFRRDSSLPNPNNQDVNPLDSGADRDDGKLKDLGSAVPTSRAWTVAWWLIGAAVCLGAVAWLVRG